MNSPRVLWLSPWMRPLARVHADSLRRRGAEVLLVTSDRHPESGAALDYELVVDTSLRTASTWRACASAWRQIREYRPDVVVAELVRDPRWIAFAGRTPRIQLIHDDRPHDPAEQLRGYERAIFDRWRGRCVATVVFSNYVANAVADRPNIASTRLHTVPLTSDLDPALVPPPVPPVGRRNFVMIGRLNPYKNLDVVLDAWQAHVTGGCWRGDDLVLLGDGPPIARALPRNTSWKPGSYRYSDVIGALSAAKGSIAHYRRASQSGVQVLSMQLGVTPIVSQVGALPEFQPPGCCPPVGVDDVQGLASTFDELADSETAVRQGVLAANHYAQYFAVDKAADRLLAILAEVAAGAPAGAAR